MRFWITKNGQVPVREQLVRQVLLGIFSADLPAGQKLPSVRALALRHRIHSNTVSAAYHDLLERGWLELRRGSGLYVRPVHPPDDGEGALHGLLASLLRTAHAQGYEPDEVLHRLEHMVRPRSYAGILVAEPEPAMREILQIEIEEQVRIPVEAVAQPDPAKAARLGRSLVVALPTRAAKARRALPPGVHCMALRLRSVPGSLEGETGPGRESLISIVSSSPEIRQWSRAMLIALGIEPECLCEVDAAGKGWQDRLGASQLVVTDVAAARELPARCPARIFRIIADSSIAELKQLCGA